MTTIAALATAQGKGAIGIVRISGPDAHEFLGKVVVPRACTFIDFKPWVLHRARFLDGQGRLLDDVLCVYMPAPKTYTGEDMAEIHCHGSPLILQTVLERLLQLGCTPAAQGEFSRRAFLNGRMDLSQAEAVCELVSARSTESLANTVMRLDGALSAKVRSLRQAIDALRAQFAVAVDFPDDEIASISPKQVQESLINIEQELQKLLAGKKRGRLMQEGARIVLLGSVNVGKSSLLNAFLGRERALVTDIAGTTRDYLEEFCDLEGLPVRLLDTAGLRAEEDSVDAVEALGIERSRACASACDLILVVLDGQSWSAEELRATRCPKAAYAEVFEQLADLPKVLVWNKADVAPPPKLPPAFAKDMPFVAVSAKTGEGFSSLIATIRTTLLGDAKASERVSCNVRQAAALEAAQSELASLREALALGQTYDCLCVQLDTAATLLGEVIGESTSAEVLDSIFGQFCIGK